MTTRPELRFDPYCQLQHVPNGGALFPEVFSTSGPGLGKATSNPSAVEHPFPTFATNMFGLPPNGAPFPPPIVT
jgi:hypothetical protein